MTLQKKLYESYLRYSAQEAIITDSSSENYNELFKNAFRISTYLLKIINCSNSIISLIFSESKNYIYGILGTLYSRNIFMPLDITHPINKLMNYFLSVDCKYTIIDRGVSPFIIEKLRKMNIKVVFIEDMIDNKVQTIIFDYKKYQEEDAIYIYFTSGSTGTPKAILGMNKSLLHFIEWEKREFNISHNDIFAQITSPAFDPYLRDIFTPLCSGAKIQLVNRNIILVPRLFGNFLKNSEITFLHMTPSILSNLMHHTFPKDHFKKLKYLLIAGEMLHPELIKAWYSNYHNHTQIVNLYGPTETTLAKVFARISYEFSDNIVPVGKPIDDTMLHVLNVNDFSECDEEEVGEIYIETEYMTLGYYNDNENFCKAKDKKKCYATGDLGYIKKGNLYLIGRKDDQLKIGGVRINLNEIRVTILAYTKIKDCAVLYEDSLLICFYVSSVQLTLKNLRRFLENYLLPIHIPHKFIKLNELPITVNGKVDKDRLINEYYMFQKGCNYKT